MLKLNLQLFADGLPEPVVVEIDGEEPEVHEPNPNQPLPVAVVAGGGGNPSMPSALAAEAWRNVEELLVTLSNNVRVNSAQQRQDIEQLRNETVQALAEMRSTLSSVTSAISELNMLMENATVEVPAEPEGKDDVKKSRGFWSRKKE